MANKSFPYKKDYAKRGQRVGAKPNPVKNSSERKESLSDIIERRNKRIVKFFSSLNMNVRLVGDKNKPAMILDDAYLINAFVHNFELNFTDKSAHGNIVYTVKLTENPDFSKEKVVECVEKFEKSEVYRIMISGTTPSLFLSGYNFLDRENKEGRYPVFSEKMGKIYFSYAKAEEVIKQLPNYNLLVW